ncbi:hypothetical protein F1559_003342 [Cyanidiococcus yangmingshanensis]|uniref:Uncharacterized protein n=1 Tax=Cyanidiococcus yangmingshanensis TaxID=2690220 RepID=A0A7J7IEG7_9RHOD|nr:hypothetical protein F1559_003342 [Cyanidiococcus yangmingshanensis]
MSKAGGQTSGRDAQPFSPANSGNEKNTGATSASAPPATIDWEALRLEIQTLRDDILFWREEARMFREEALSLRRLHKGRMGQRLAMRRPCRTGKPEIIPRPAQDKLSSQADEQAWEKELRTLEHRLERMMTTVNRLVQARMHNLDDTHSGSGIEAESRAPVEHPSLPQAPQKHNALNWLTGSPTADELGADTGDDPDDTQVSREVVRLLRTRHHHRRRVEAPAPAKQPTEAADSNQYPPLAEEYRLPLRQSWQNAILRQVEETQRVIAATQKRLERERAAFLRRTHAQPVPRLSDDDLTA